MSFILSILSKLKIQHYAIIAVVALTAALSYSIKQTAIQKKARLMERSNYENLRDKDSLKIAVLQFKSRRDLEDYVNSSKELRTLLQAQEIKTRNIRNIAYQKQVYKDTVKTVTDVSAAVIAIKQNTPIVLKWVDSTVCLTVKGNVTYANDSLSVNVTDREFRNSILIVGGMQRNLWSVLGIFKTRFLGKWKAKVTATSTCGDTETTIIERVK